MFQTRTKQALSSLKRVALPTIIATVLGFLYFDNLSLYIRSTLDIGTIRLLMEDEAQFIQNFLTVIGLLFSILAGNAYAALYQQQETIYFALFQEVSEAKSLLEQTTLVCQGRPFYRAALRCISDYVKNDLRRLDVPPAQLLSTRPMEDPLESIMYMTSVGVPSIVYETVKNLRQARGYRLGAMQRKFPLLGIALLYLLAGVELLAFPLLGAGTANSVGILSLQSFLFACLAGAHMLVLRIIQELWQSSGGVFNVDEVLQQIVFGLEEELEMRSRNCDQQGGTRSAWGTQPNWEGQHMLSDAEYYRAYAANRPSFDSAQNIPAQPSTEGTQARPHTETWEPSPDPLFELGRARGAESLRGFENEVAQSSAPTHLGEDKRRNEATVKVQPLQMSSPPRGESGQDATADVDDNPSKLTGVARMSVLSAVALSLTLPRSQRVAIGRVGRALLGGLQKAIIG